VHDLEGERSTGRLPSADGGGAPILVAVHNVVHGYWRWGSARILEGELTNIEGGAHADWMLSASRILEAGWERAVVRAYAAIVVAPGWMRGRSTPLNAR
jgi:hypothetical protein